jgi:dipeptidase E
MRLLLTSAGITNDSIEKALEELAARPLCELKMAFIPTAANVEEGGKEWLARNLMEFEKLGFLKTDILDISILSKNVLEEKLKDVDILIFGGGDTAYLNDWVIKSELKDLLPEMLKTKVYVGISAGSIITCDKIDIEESEEFFQEKIGADQNIGGLGMVEFYVIPHFNAEYFPNINSENIKRLTENYPNPIYDIDDQTANKLTDAEIEVVSEGEWEKY